MPVVTLTDITVRNVRCPQKGQLTYWDKTLKGFNVRVSQGGTKTFTVVVGQSRRRITIGRYPVISLADARDEAKQILAAHTLGSRAVLPIPFEDAVERFLADCESRNKPRTVYDYKRLLSKHFKFRRTKVSEVTQQEVLRRILKLKDTPTEQNHAFVAIRAFLRWAVRHHYAGESPLEGLSLPATKRTRDRVLNDEELIAVFTRAEKFPYPFGPIVSLLILTGQRKNEIANLRWEWIGEGTITLPPSITKNSREHTFPVGSVMQGVIQTIPKTSDYLFPSIIAHYRGKPTTVFNAWSKKKREFDSGLSVEPYTLHDLRRTFASRLAQLATPIHVTEKLLNHVSGSISGVTAVYNRHTYMDEMREAITRYEQYLIELSSPRA